MDADEPREILVRTPWGGPWRRFANPVRVIAARDHAQVRAALREVDQEVSHGRYAAGFVTYEAAAAFGLPVHDAEDGLPCLCFGIFEADDVEHLLRLPATGEASFGAWHPSIDHPSYLAAIAAIKARIEAGDTYQINFTFRMSASFDGEPLALMRRVFAAQAGPWSAYVDIGRHVICSASPELFFCMDGERIVCRPMKGTWARGYWPAQDAAQGEALHRSPKNRAENVMIVDMVRNDIGRIAKTGTVRVSSLFDVERYPSQWQMTSTVEGLTDRRSLGELFAAMFPCGSITGAPKVSSMQIIRSLESTPRGIYTGAIGYVSPDGRGHFSVAIRTVVLDRSRRVAEFGVGSGVVWDSIDRDEYDECILKAEMLRTSPDPRVRGSMGPGTSQVRTNARLPGASYVVADPPDFALLETILWTPESGFVLLDRHLERLRASARSFGFVCALDDVRAQLADAVEDLRGPSRARVMLEAGGGVLCEAMDLRALPERRRAALAAEPVDRSDVFLYHKTTKRGGYERARASRPEADAVILWNELGEVTEGTEANVVIARQGRKVTPPVECGLLPGILRAELLAAGEIEESRISKEELVAADEVWLINSVRGWMPVAGVMA